MESSIEKWALRVFGWGGFAAASYLWGVAGFFLVFGLSALMYRHTKRITDAALA